MKTESLDSRPALVFRDVVKVNTPGSPSSITEISAGERREGEEFRLRVRVPPGRFSVS
jgi:hypothetical protein